MELSRIVFEQIIVMFLLMAFGYFAYRNDMIHEKGVSNMSSVLLKIVNPMITIRSFHRAFILDEALDFGLVFMLSFVVIGVGILIGTIFFKRDRIERFAIAFSNAGFMGIPLVEAMLGVEYVFYIAAFLVVLNIMVWSYGVYLISGSMKDVTLKSILWNPATISLYIGLVVYAIPFTLPNVVTKTMDYVVSLNAPLAMIVLGAFLAKEPLIKVLNDKKLYLVSFMRLIVVPLIVIGLLRFIPLDYNIKMVLVLVAAVPSGVFVAMFAQMYNKNYEHAARAVSLSTILALITLPLMIQVGTWLL